jgi:hypothetical protein|nr:MAG TPA: hypothetical protein [Caudoviricetes sp.]
MLVHEYDKDGVWEVYNLYGEANSEIYLWESWNEEQENCSYPFKMQVKIKVPMFYVGTLSEFDEMIYNEIVKLLEEKGLVYKYEGKYYWM